MSDAHSAACQTGRERGQCVLLMCLPFIRDEVFLRIPKQIHLYITSGCSGSKPVLEPIMSNRVGRRNCDGHWFILWERCMLPEQSQYSLNKEEQDEEQAAAHVSCSGWQPHLPPSPRLLGSQNKLSPSMPSYFRGMHEILQVG